MLLTGGTVSAITAGIILPSISLFMGNISVAFSGETSKTELVQSNLTKTMGTIAMIVVMVAISIFLFSYIFYAFWSHLAANITNDLKKKYIESLLRQEIGYFERNKVEQIPAQISEIFEQLQNSIGEKIANLIFALSTCIASMGYGLYFGWAFALACIAYLPFLILIIAVFGKRVQKSTVEKLEGVK